MNTAFETAMITGYEHLIPEMTNHVKDRHVLAAAVASDADRIITCNLRDFPPDSCESRGVEPEHPDDFLLGLWDREPRLITRVITEQAADTGRHGPRLTPFDVLAYLANAGAHQFAETVRPRISEQANKLNDGQYSVIAVSD